MKQTAVEWLVRELNQELNYIPIAQWDRIRDIVQRAKEVEKEEIMDAYAQGIADEAGEIIDATKDAEKYYNETYGRE